MKRLAGMYVCITAIVLSAAGCAGVVNTLAPHEIERKEGVGRLEQEEQIFFFRHHKMLFAHIIEERIIPRLRREVALILERGWARGLNSYDLNHVHIRYPRSVDLRARPPLRVLLSERTYHLLYHCRENPPLQRAAWIDELTQIDDDTIQTWLERLHRHDFSYADFFYGSGTYTRSPSVEEETLRHIAQRWNRELHASGKDVAFTELLARLRFIIGPEQPGYLAAARRLFSWRTVISVDGETPLRLYRMKQVELSGYWQPATIYFSRSERDDELSFWVTVHAFSNDLRQQSWKR